MVSVETKRGGEKWNFELNDPLPEFRYLDSHLRGLRDATPRWKQVCIIPFRRDFLFRYLELEPTVLERAESIDMNRVLEHGIKVRMVPSRDRTVSVDTAEDLATVKELMASDSLVASYLRLERAP